MTNNALKRNVFQVVVLLIMVTLSTFQYYPVSGKHLGKNGKQEPSTLDDDIFSSDSFFTDKKNVPRPPDTSNEIKTPAISQDSVQNLTSLLSRIGDTSDSEVPAPTERTSLSLQDLEASSGGLLDQLTGLIGWSSLQVAIYPILMILVAGFSGIFWTWVFIYLYTYFFTGKGYFGGGSSGFKGRAQSIDSPNWILNSLPGYVLTATQNWDEAMSAWK